VKPHEGFDCAQTRPGSRSAYWVDALPLSRHLTP
jgi:hypothetical protein